MKILVAEDEVELANALVAILKSSKYLVDVVYDGEDALAYLETNRYDGAILDIMMPKMDGITVLKTLRKSGNQVPVLLLTAKAEVDDRVLGLDSGADDYLPKPFAMKELLARLRAMTRRKQEIISNILTFEDLSLNCETFELFTQSGSVLLTNKEFQMMEMFLAMPKRVISVEQFMEKIWGYDSEVENNAVWVYISYLRKKIVQLESKVQIKVSRNIGYFLEGSS